MLCQGIFHGWVFINKGGLQFTVLRFMFHFMSPNFMFMSNGKRKTPDWTLFAIKL